MASAGVQGGGDGDVIVLDGDDEEEEEEEREGGGPAPSPPPPPPPPEPAPARREEKEAAPTGGLRAENQRLFQEFVDFCSEHTKEHPEVMPFLAGRHQKTCPQFLASVEFRNVLGRCLTRVQAKRSKVYVYINELCTVLKANSQKRKLVPSTSAAPGAEEAPAAPPDPAESATEPPKPQGGSKRQIRYLENLLRVYAVEIRRLQEQELDLEELDREDSAYLQESRLKRRMMRIFKRLCELKECDSLTGRVIEQRIPYRGTRFPEVNRRIERLINRPDAFPDYNDILKVVQKASNRHNLGLPKRQMESMATCAFEEVGNSLQERRHLDLVYNFGSHLTDQYQPGSDPALRDGELARRLRDNREQALRRLEEVMLRYAQLQDKGEEEEWRRKRGLPPSGAAGRPQGGAASPPPSEGARREGRLGATRKDDLQTEEEEEEEEEESSSESDLEAELENTLEDGGEEEEGPAAAPGEDFPVQDVEADQSLGPGTQEVVPYSSSEEDLEEEEEEEEEEEAEQQRGAEEQSPQTPEPIFLLAAEEAPSLEASETPPPSPPLPPWTKESGLPLALPLGQKAEAPVKHGRSLENGRGPREADQTSIPELSGSPPHKKCRQELWVSDSTCIEVPSGGSSEEEDQEGGDGGPCCSPPPLHSPAPLADSTCVDSPGLCLVSSSQESPAAVCKASVATQCDPEEIIVLSDSE